MTLMIGFAFSLLLTHTLVASYATRPSGWPGNVKRLQDIAIEIEFNHFAICAAATLGANVPSGSVVIILITTV